VEGYYDIRCLTGLWSTQAKVEVIVLKTAWYWISDSNVANDPLGEPSRTPLYICLPSAWGSVGGDRMFSPISWEGFLSGDSDRYKLMNNALAIETEHLSPWGSSWGTWRSSLPRTLKER
jgi:hypothetical protein